MSSLFTNILIPVDFSVNTDVAVEKAIELAQPVNPVIHLFHTSNTTPSTGEAVCYGYCFYAIVSSGWYNGEIEMKMQRYADIIRTALPSAAVIPHMVAGGNVKQNIVDMANQTKADLIIIGKRKSHKWFPFFNTVDPSSIAKKTNSVVLTVKPGAAENHMKAVVLPVGSFYPERKIQLLKALSHKNRPKIYLVAMHDKHSEPGAFVETYRTLSEHMHHPIEYKLLNGHNFPRAILNYSKRVSADLILVNPYSETKTNAFYGTDICDLIPPSSKLAVLAAEPFHQKNLKGV